MPDLRTFVLVNEAIRQGKPLKEAAQFANCSQERARLCLPIGHPFDVVRRIDDVERGILEGHDRGWGPRYISREVDCHLNKVYACLKKNDLVPNDVRVYAGRGA